MRRQRQAGLLVGRIGLVATLCLAHMCQAFIPAARLGVSHKAPQRSSGRSAGALSMAESIEVFMPALSSTMTEGKIVDWTVKVGDKVKAGQTVMIVESDKAEMDCEAFEDGFVAAILTKAGQTAPVGAPVAVMAKKEADIAAVQASLSSGGSASTAAAPAAAAPVAAAAPAATGGGSAPNVDFEEVFMPALSSTMTEGKIVAWSVKPGDKVKEGDELMVVESDKADMSAEAFTSGIFAAVVTREGESAPVGAPVALIAKKEADVAALQAYAQVLRSGGGAAPAAAAPAASAAPVAAAPAASAAPIVNDGRVIASGYAKKVAGESGVDLRTVPGTGPGGRIVAEDVKGAAAGGAGTGYQSKPGTATPGAKRVAAEAGLDLTKVKGTGNFGRVTEHDVLVALGRKPAFEEKKAAPAPAAAAGGEKKAAAPAGPTPVGLVPMDGMMKAVAKNMEKTLDVPIFRVSRTITTDKFDELYKKVKPQGVTVSALLAKAVANTLVKHPIINAAYDASGAIKYNSDINIAMAVALDGGLITPTLKNADKVDIYSLGRKWKELVKKAQEKRLAADEYSTGTFTISNLGMFQVSAFDAILPPGQGSILAIGSSVPTVVVQPNGFIGVEKQMTVTITCDHRHIYGAQAAEFLVDLAKLLEKDVESLLF